MSQILFQPAKPDSPFGEGLRHVFAVDAMMVSYPATAEMADGIITVTLPTDQSCRIHFPWRVHDTDVMLSTSSLPGRKQPYRYELEIARGTVGLLVEKFAEWREEQTGFSPDSEGAVSASRAALVDAIFQSDPESAAASSRKAIELSLAAVSILVDDYVRLRQRQGKTTALRVCVDQDMLNDFWDNDTSEIIPGDVEAGNSPEDREDALSGLLHFDRISLKLPDESDQTMEQDIAYIGDSVERFRSERSEAGTVELRDEATTTGRPAFQIGIGPILDWKNQSVDDWFQGENSFEAIRNSLFQWGNAFASKVDRHVAPIYVASGIGAQNSSKFTDHQRLQLTLDSMSGINHGNSDFEQMVSFYQPIGSEIDSGSGAVSPLHAADALLRTDVNLTKIGLEISFADFSRPTTRDLLQISSMINAWRQFDLPLVVVLELPAIASICNSDICGQQHLDIRELQRTCSMLYAMASIEEILLCSAGDETPPILFPDSQTLSFLEIARKLLWRKVLPQGKSNPDRKSIPDGKSNPVTGNG